MSADKNFVNFIYNHSLISTRCLVSLAKSSTELPISIYRRPKKILVEVLLLDITVSSMLERDQDKCKLTKECQSHKSEI